NCSLPITSIGSQLFEDDRLEGDYGILVNVTSGLNLSMKEFEEVGNTVADLASDDATVVIGTVIDPDMTDDLRVTVVATGLGNRKPKTEKKPMQVVRTGTDSRPVQFTATSDDETPAAPAPGSTETGELFGSDDDSDYLDIPAFLRNSAD